jgi:uncharacterized protein YbjT (DUF2867 family)
MQKPLSVVMLGATGAVGGHVVSTLLRAPRLQSLTLLGRRNLPDLPSPIVKQHTVDVFAPDSYSKLVGSHNVAICTLGVGEPSKIDKAEFVRVDRDAVLDFARACKQAGVAHFSILSSVGANAASASFYLRVKGELQDGLKALKFERLSLFEPSVILTPTNRYGFSQGVLLATVPLLKPLLQGGLQKYRGIAVERLGAAIANNLSAPGAGVETLQWQ